VCSEFVTHIQAKCDIMRANRDAVAICGRRNVMINKSLWSAIWI